MRSFYHPKRRYNYFEQHFSFSFINNYSFLGPMSHADDVNVGDLLVGSLKDLAAIQDPAVIKRMAPQFFLKGLNFRTERVLWEKIISNLVNCSSFTQKDYLCFEGLFIRLRLKNAKIKLPLFPFSLNPMVSMILSDWLQPNQKFCHSAGSILKTVRNDHLIVLNYLKTSIDFHDVNILTESNLLPLTSDANSIPFIIMCLFDCPKSAFEHRYLNATVVKLGVKVIPEWILSHAKRKI